MDKHNPKCKYDKLFSNVYALMVPDAVNIYLNKNRGVAEAMALQYLTAIRTEDVRLKNTI